MESIVLSGDW
uniref:Uncharacterized protein n=1 Tax=Arundo donax TaxID=35708 RepID=A0A0A9FA65_ARUDO